MHLNVIRLSCSPYKSKEGSSFKLRFRTSPAALVLKKKKGRSSCLFILLNNRLLRNTLEKFSNDRQLL